MENMESKRMENYFDKAKSLPVAMSIAKVMQLISAKGVTSPPKKSWWNLNNLIIMTTSILLISSAILTFQSTQISNELKAYEPSLTSISYAQLGDYETVGINAPFSIIESSVPNKQVFVPILTELTGDSVVEQTTSEMKTVAESPVMTFEEPAAPIVPSAPQEHLDEPLESNLGGDFEGESKTLTKTFDVGGITTLDISHKNGDINIETWDQEKIEVSATFSVKAEKPEDEQLALSDFDFSLNPMNTKAVVESNWDDINNCACGPNKTSASKKKLLKFLYFSSDSKNNKAKTDNGEDLEYENFKIVYTIKIPRRLNIDVSNQYANITVPEIDGNLDATVFRGNLIAKNIGGDLDLTVKYGNAAVGNYQEGSVTLFRGDLELGSGNRLNLKSNYSEVALVEATELNINAFRSNLTANSGLDELEGSFKYGDLTIKGHVVEGDLKLFRSNLKGVSFDQLDLSASYSSLVADKALVLNLEEGFRTDFKVTEVGNLSGNIKYSPLKIETLKNEIDIKTFRGELEVELIQADFSSVRINAKYTNVDLSFSPEAKYELDATTTYTEFKVPEEIMEKSHQNGVNGHANHFVGTFNKASQRQASTVNVESFQGFLKLN